MPNLRWPLPNSRKIVVNMRIVIDMQGAQSKSRLRGIGRYTLSFVEAVIRNKGEHEVILALSGLLPEAIEPIRAAFDGLLSQENIRVWHAVGPVRECEPGNAGRRQAAELIREAFLASLNPDVLHITSIFEGYVDDAVTSVGRLGTRIPTSIILYDLIPLLNPAQYLSPHPGYADYYLGKIQYLKNADRLLAISDFTRKEGVDNLQVSYEVVVNISSAADPCFTPIAVDENFKDFLKTQFGIVHSFILCAGSADERKNLPRLIQAYAKLPAALRRCHQMVFVGHMSDDEIDFLRQMALDVGMELGELVIIGYIGNEQLVKLYSLCRLYIFPSWHEGFGLPALEAMACGAVVVGANASSLPEVINLSEALFDPFDADAIFFKLHQGLVDESFRTRLLENSAKQLQKFSWDKTAKSSIAAWEKCQSQNLINLDSNKKIKPRLAFVSPLPPERTGIADYSAELIPPLTQFYDIDIVVEQTSIEDAFINRTCKVRDSEWLRENIHEVDRVVYQLGNSPFHQHMLGLMREIPGTVVLHDFYLSGLKAWLELNSKSGECWVNALYESHGYKAVRDRYVDIESAQCEYPVNFDVLQYAQGIIVHSGYSRQLVKHWYGEHIAARCQVIPLLRTAAVSFDKALARQHLGLDPNDFLICSFGFLDASKLNDRLLDCWLSSSLSEDKNCRLVFVGENHGGDYGFTMSDRIRKSGVANRILITGFVAPEIFKQYLMAADLAVQLRTNSRGETSAAVLDCMNFGLPLILNANGSMAELDEEDVWRLPDEFDSSMLINALETLRESPEKRRQLGERGRHHVINSHDPTRCAGQYFEFIEACYGDGASAISVLVAEIVRKDNFSFSDNELRQLAKQISSTLPMLRPAKRLFLDVTATCRDDLKTGIERVVRALLIALIDEPIDNYRIEPVYLDNVNSEWIHRYARRYTLGLLGCPTDVFKDDIVELENGDILLSMDLSGGALVQAADAGLYVKYRNQGVLTYAIVFDLLPVLMPEVFPPGADQIHLDWLQAISQFDGAICISKTVADDFANWQKNTKLGYENRRPYHIGWFYLGSDFTSTGPSFGVPSNAKIIINQLQLRPTFLMVGTIEPRKGYLQIIKAFSQLWAEGLDVNLVIVGREGWQGLTDDLRRDIPETIDCLNNNPEINNRLYWLKHISDEYLEQIYSASTCLIAASYSEGFGLPLIEAAQRNLPIIARDIPIFHEVAGSAPRYFRDNASNDFLNVVRDFINDINLNKKQEIEIMSIKNWKESASSLMKVINNFIQPVDLKEVRKRAMDLHLNLIHEARIKMVSTLLPAGEIILDLGGANCPLYKMNYPYTFKKIYVIDLPPEDRHDMYKEIVIDENCAGGEVIIKYGDMTNLNDFPDESADFIWSGQSIEHVSPEAGEQMCRAAFRVLKRGGAFCLDTPNRKLTEIHLKGTGLEFVHPEHCIEYKPEHLKQVLLRAGFDVVAVKGICDMPRTVKTGEFYYEDFMFGNQITDDVHGGYIQFFHCIKP